MGASVNKREDRRDENQRSDGCAKEAANDRSPQGRVLLAAVTQSQSHRNHADDHGQRGHEHGPEPCESGFDSGLEAGLHAR